MAADALPELWEIPMSDENDMSEVLKDVKPEDQEAHAAGIGRKMVSTNRPKFHKDSAEALESVKGFVGDLSSAVDELNRFQTAFQEGFAGLLSKVRVSRMSLTSEKMAMLTDLKDMTKLLTGEDMGKALDRYERLVELSERMAKVAGDGWLDKVLLALLGEKS